MDFARKEDLEEIGKLIKVQSSFLNKKNIAISGAFGFIGKYLIECLLRLKKKYNSNLNIYAIDNFITSDETSKEYFKNKDVVCITHDINFELNIENTFDYIICLAGIASPYYYNKFPVQTLDVSINGIKNMNKLKQNDESKLIFFSSSEIYGDPTLDQIPTKEDYRGNVTSVGPRSCYDESKRIGETICYINSNFFKKKTAIIRPFNVYGPGMSIKDYRIIPNITRSLFLNEELKVYETGTQTRTYCYIVDVINGFLRVIFKNEKFGIYNIGNDIGEVSVLDLVHASEEVMNTKIKYKKTPYPKEYPPDEPQRRCPDITRANENLGYYPQISLKEGLKRHFEWYKKNI